MKPTASTRTLRPAIGEGLGSRVKARLISLVLAALLGSTGCAGLELLGLRTAKFEKADAKNPAVEILALWQPAEGPGPGGVPTRGFAGQIFFLTQSKPAPVMVEGKVRIYLFDDRGSLKEQARPLREFDVDSALWNAHCHQSTLGPAYSVFIPYPREDFHQSSCSLRVRFTPTIGPPIYSPTSTVVLPGPAANRANASESGGRGTQASGSGPKELPNLRRSAQGVPPLSMNGGPSSGDSLNGGSSFPGAASPGSLSPGSLGSLSTARQPSVAPRSDSMAPQSTTVFAGRGFGESEPAATTSAASRSAPITLRGVDQKPAAADTDDE